MEFIKRLANNIFGKRKIYVVKDLGTFNCKVLNCLKNKNYHWFASLQLPSYSEETFVCVDGDENSPYVQQTDFLKTILKNWKDMLEQIDRVLPKHVRNIKNRKIFIYWKKNFYPESISMQTTSGNEVEITFTTYDLEHSFCFVLKDGYVRNLTLNDEEMEDVQPEKEYRYYFFDYLYYIGEIWSKSNYKMDGSTLLFLYYTFIITIPLYFGLIHKPETNNNYFRIFYLVFSFVFPCSFNLLRYRKKRKTALMKHFHRPKKIGVITAIFFLLVPIGFCWFAIWLYTKLGWITSM